MIGLIEQRMAALLRGGMLAALAIMCSGAVWYLAIHGADRVDYRGFHSTPILSSDGRGLMQLGIIILVATPIARVAFSVAAFARARDRAYAAATAIVLCTLLYSLLGGH